MAKFKKCPRCEINYIPLEKEYCEICEKEMKGEAHYEEEEDYEEGVLCPRCRVNYLAEGEKLCESCLAEIEKEKEPSAAAFGDWEEEENVDDEEAIDEEDIIMPDELSLEAIAEEEDELLQEELEGDPDEYADEDDDLDDLDAEDFADDDEDEEEDEEEEDY